MQISTTRRSQVDDPDTEVVDPRLVVVERDPFNAESPLGLQQEVITPTPLFYVRTNFGAPKIELQNWKLTIDGGVESPIRLSYEELLGMPARSLVVTLECAGNGRSAITPRVEGEPWQYGAVSTAEWTGVPLVSLLEQTPLDARAREVLVEGADHGSVTNRSDVAFARSLPLDKALHPDTLLAYAINGKPLTRLHGFPLRLLVPGWYGMASVKWVTGISAILEPYRGYFQWERYVLKKRAEVETGEPLNVIRIRSLMVWPAPGDVVPIGSHVIRGFAWSGEGPIERVEVSVDGGQNWQLATLSSPPERYAWRRWEYTWNVTTSGNITLQTRAFDAKGGSQPGEPQWNVLGYANNAVQPVRVTVIE